MTFDQTLIESSSPVGNAARGIQSPPTVYEQLEQPLSPIESALNLVPGAVLLKYRLEKSMQVVSGEADLWMAVDPLNRTVVLKIYRWGLRPKEEVSEKVSKISLAQVVEVYERGVVCGRHYEAMEYARFGTLVDLWKSDLTDAQQRDVLRELTDAVSALHQENLLHRDLKPSNILVRAREPLDLIVSDFGISSLAEISIYVSQTIAGTPAYSAPEVMTGAICKASDWWSVGVIMLELLSGRHPFAGLDSRQINFALATKGIPISTKLPDVWKPLLKGLLTRDHSRRWNEISIKKWLSGEANIPVHYEGDAAVPHSHKYRPYRFLEQDYYSPGDLAVELAQHWDDGLDVFQRLLILEWVKQQVQDQDLTNSLLAMREDPKLNREQCYALGLVAMNKELPLSWRGRIVNPALLANDSTLAVEFLESSVSSWLDRLKKENSLKDLIKRYNSGKRALQSLGMEVDLIRTARAVLANESSVYGLAYRAQREYRDATLPGLLPLLSKAELSWSEALALAVAPPHLFIRREDVTPESLALGELAEAIQSEGKGPYSLEGEQRIVDLWEENQGVLGASSQVDEETAKRVADASGRLTRWAALESALGTKNERQILAAWGGDDLMIPFAPASPTLPNIDPWRKAVGSLDAFIEQVRNDPNDDVLLWKIWAGGSQLLEELNVSSLPVDDLGGLIPSDRAKQAKVVAGLVQQMRQVVAKNDTPLLAEAGEQEIIATWATIGQLLTENTTIKESILPRVDQARQRIQGWQDFQAGFPDDDSIMAEAWQKGLDRYEPARHAIQIGAKAVSRMNAIRSIVKLCQRDNQDESGLEALWFHPQQSQASNQHADLDDCLAAQRPLAALGNLSPRERIQMATDRLNLLDRIKTTLGAGPRGYGDLVGLWDEKLCGSHRLFEVVRADVLHALRLFGLKGMVENGLNSGDDQQVCNCWESELAQLFTQQDQGQVKSAFKRHIAGPDCFAPPKLGALIDVVGGSSKTREIKIQWRWMDPRILFYWVAVADGQYPEPPPVVDTPLCHDSDKPQDSSYKIDFSGTFPHICIWPVVRILNEFIVCDQAFKSALHKIVYRVEWSWFNRTPRIVFKSLTGPLKLPPMSIHLSSTFISEMGEAVATIPGVTVEKSATVPLAALKLGSATGRRYVWIRPEQTLEASWLHLEPDGVNANRIDF